MTTSTGPVLRGDNIAHRHPDGTTEYRFRQSWLGTFYDCPELARRQMTGVAVRTENDAASVGTALHGAIEEAINHKIATGQNWGPLSVVEAWHDQWDALLEQYDVQFVKRGPKGAVAYGERCAERFADLVLPELRPWATEVGFGPIELARDHDTGRFLTVTGTVDYLDERWPVDWKTASRPYEPWEKQRWAIQPTVYTTALREHLRGGDYPGDLEAWQYIVFPDGNKTPVQWVPVQRTPEWDPWLVTQMWGIADMIDANMATWPMRDQHALCSPKWCGEFFRGCKGTILGPEAVAVAFPGQRTS